jgi:cell wall-associated NlpC family hydrolase
MLSKYKGLFIVSAAILLFSSCHSLRRAVQTPSPSPVYLRKKSEPVAKIPSASSDVNNKSKRPLRKKVLKRKYAAVLKTSPGKIKNKRLYYFIDEWYGVKYKWGGNSQSGIDCSGLVCQLYKKVYGVDIKRTVATQHDDTRNFRRKRRLREGDLIYFKTEGDDLSHVGVYLKNGYFLHSSKSKGVAINSIYETYWQRVYAGGGKVRRKKA